jgi:GTP-binding protein
VVDEEGALKMNITAEFMQSSPDVKICPVTDLNEYAFIGRSNVGKSSLLNMLCNHKNLAKTSGKPGKTRLINHFKVTTAQSVWAMADLPGYGYAKVSKKERGTFELMIRSYLTKRPNLVCAFILLDGRHDPQKNDLEFMEWLGNKEVPFAMVFTKADKLTDQERADHLERYSAEMLKTWEFLPEIFHTSATTGLGRETLLAYIDEVNKAIDLD